MQKYLTNLNSKPMLILCLLCSYKTILYWRLCMANVQLSQKLAFSRFLLTQLCSPALHKSN